MTESMTTVAGGCHCGQVRYEAQVSSSVTAQRCNCSICSQTGFIHVIVPAARFSLLSGQEDIAEYTFNSRTARHLFCSRCGVKSFYVPRSNPDGFSLNLNCLDLPDEMQVEIEEFDGQNWEKNADELAELSRL